MEFEPLHTSHLVRNTPFESYKLRTLWETVMTNGDIKVNYNFSLTLILSYRAGTGRSWYFEALTSISLNKLLFYRWI